MSLDKGKDISWAFKILFVAMVLLGVYLIGLLLDFPVSYFFGLAIGIVAALLIFLILFKLPKIYVKVSKY